MFSHESVTLIADAHYTHSKQDLKTYKICIKSIVKMKIRNVTHMFNSFSRRPSVNLRVIQDLH